ncbi:3-deoxy-D-manno-octulosonic acid transferase [Neotabrizicola shimadae]|uniref:3-deoxy-D-manno-octulosonic acid transferase n=1 Tax=Neotabrizicola shimadae TaxID=2807096 RepID=A0A8G1EDL1_9RHOB|nr:glycosyltransferase N-terminal domain-containing protein [Neotabrizicola shimadae]QYZ71652.1 3-deoxy-D-manno-octulosonic acid transferase [Neotabrizicola shimadae]
MMLFAYRLLMGIALPFAVLATLWGMARGRLPGSALRERLGLGPKRQGGAPAIWVHGASLGELTSVKALIRRLRDEVPGLEVLVTSNTATAREMVAGWQQAGVEARLAPFDTAGAAARVIRGWRPDLMIVVENELWPGRMAAARAAGVPVAMVGARMSERSARRWGKVPGMRGLLEGLALVSPQDEGSAARLVALGLPRDRLAPVLNLKAGVEALAPVTGPVARDRCLLAASTHEGEEALVLDGFAEARGQFDLLILAPRHPARFDAVAREIAARGFALRRRSAGDDVAGPVFLADTLGEMALWYGMAGATVVGGTFADRGGHTPFEPVAAGSAVVHGPSLANHRDAFAALDAAGGALAVTGDLGAALAGLDGSAQTRMAAAGRAALAGGVELDGLAARLLAPMRHARG